MKINWAAGIAALLMTSALHAPAFAEDTTILSFKNKTWE